MNRIQEIGGICPNVDKSSTLSSFKNGGMRMAELLWSSVQVKEQQATEVRGLKLIWSTILMRAKTCQRAKLLTTSKKTFNENKTCQRAKLPAGYIGTGLTTSKKTRHEYIYIGTGLTTSKKTRHEYIYIGTGLPTSVKQRLQNLININK